MSQQVTINGKKFEPSAALAREFGYSMDYISRLAREGKVEATRVGRQWFVEAISLKKFVEDISKQKEVSREQLRTERKRELVAHSQNSAAHNLKVNNFSAGVITEKKSVAQNRGVRNFAKIASTVAGSALVMVAGLLSTAVISPDNFYSFYSTFDLNKTVHDFSVQRGSDVAAGALGSWFKTTETAQVTVEKGTGIPASGIVVLEEEKSSTELEKIRASFSDEVEVDFNGEDTGVITPVFKKNKGEDYQFLLVPVDDAS